MTGHAYVPDDTGFACRTCGQPEGSCVPVPSPPAERGRHRAAPRDAADPAPLEPWSELGYARRLIAVYGNRLRYVPQWKRWLAWDGQRWAHDATGQSARWMKAIARRVTADALAEPGERERRAAVNLARRGESAAGVAGRSPWPAPSRRWWPAPTTWTPTRSC